MRRLENRPGSHGLKSAINRIGNRFGAARLKRFGREQSGSVMTTTVIVLPLLFGIAGLAVDVSVSFGSKRALQDATDAGAMAGAAEILRTGSVDTILAAGQTAALAEGAENTNGSTLQINYPPTSGSQTGAGDAIEVIATMPLDSFFSGIFHQGPNTVASRSVAVAGITDNCIWALNPDVKGAITVSGGATVQIGCGVISNSTNTESLVQTGSSCLTAAAVKAAGGAVGSCISPAPLENVMPRPDPLADLQAPEIDSCDYNGKTKVNAGDTAVLSPGVYCGSIEIAAGGTVEFLPGLYVLDGAGLTINGSADVQGTDVSFYLTERSGTSKSVDISAGANVSLTAPEGGELPGVLFYHDRNAPTNVAHNLTGGSFTYLEGIAYFPNSQVTLAGGSTLDANKTLIIADTVVFTGNTEVGGIDESVVQSNPNLVVVKLVE